jgi:hypothetical protein
MRVSCPGRKSGTTSTGALWLASTRMGVPRTPTPSDSHLEYLRQTRTMRPSSPPSQLIRAATRPSVEQCFRCYDTTATVVWGLGHLTSPIRSRLNLSLSRQGVDENATGNEPSLAWIGRQRPAHSTMWIESRCRSHPTRYAACSLTQKSAHTRCKVTSNLRADSGGLCVLIAEMNAGSTSVFQRSLAMSTGGVWISSSYPEKFMFPQNDQQLSPGCNHVPNHFIIPIA